MHPVPVFIESVSLNRTIDPGEERKSMKGKLGALSQFSERKKLEGQIKDLAEGMKKHKGSNTNVPGLFKERLLAPD